MAASELPVELNGTLSAFHQSLEDVEKTLEPLMCQPMSQLIEKMEPLEKARMHLVSAYALNSLFWMHLKTKGKDIDDYAIKHELARIKDYMKHLQEINDKKYAPRVNISSAKRFIRHALWEAQTSDQKTTTTTTEKPQSEQ